MSKYVPDISSHRWVIISPQRTHRPTDLFDRKAKKVCPFCPGNESLTPETVLQLYHNEKKDKNWQVRVIPNKFPITDLHEVIIHSPSCELDIEDLPIKDVALIFQAYRQRYQFYKTRGQIIIFCNHGEHAGASLDHPHSQLVVIPPQINMDVLFREPLSNVILENTYFNVYCPDFSQWPYETWFVPKKRTTTFGDITDDEIVDLVELLQRVLKQLRKIYVKNQHTLLPFDYNYYIHPKEDWYLRLIPRFVHRAGFELGTGLHVNIVDPALAALELKGFEKNMAGVLNKLKKKI